MTSEAILINVSARGIRIQPPQPGDCARQSVWEGKKKSLEVERKASRNPTNYFKRGIKACKATVRKVYVEQPACSTFCLLYKKNWPATTINRHQKE
jgi:hypothetical protein